MHNLPLLFKGDYLVFSGEGSYRPLATFTYFLDYAVYGLNPWGYHATNILLNAINGVLLYIFLTLLLKQSNIDSSQSPSLNPFHNTPLLICLLFVTHPIVTEAVNAISFREDLLVFLFYISSLILYLLLRSDTRNAHRPITPIFLYAGSCLLYILALFSKEMAVTLPLIAYCYEFIYADKKKGRLRSTILNRFNIGLIIITFAYSFIRFHIFSSPIKSDLPLWNPFERILTVPWLLLNYLKVAVLPVSLSADYVIDPVKSFASLAFIVPFIAIVSLLTFSIAARPQKKGILFGALFFLITLLPVYNIIPVANPFAERYLYLPVIGLLILAASVMGQLLNQKYRYFICTAIILIFCIYSFSTIKRNAVWENFYSLSSDTIKKMPRSFRFHNNLGHIYHQNRQYYEAIKHFQAAIGVNPDYIKSYMNLGMAYAETGQIEKAVLQFKTVLKLEPDHHNAHNNLGVLYERQGRYDEAISEYSIAMRIKPNDPICHYNLGMVYSKQLRYDEAIRELRNATLLSPGYAMAHYNLGVIHLKKGLKEKARTELETTIRLRPDFSPARQAIEALRER